MKFKSIANPTASKGVSFKGHKKLVVPDQSMTLEEILRRFTRGESLEIGRDPVFDEEGEDDLEKVQHMDLVERQEYVNRLKQTRVDFEKQEKRRAATEKKRLDKLAVDKLAADKLAAEKAAEKQSKNP